MQLIKPKITLSPKNVVENTTIITAPKPAIITPPPPVYNFEKKLHRIVYVLKKGTFTYGFSPFIFNNFSDCKHAYDLISNAPADTYISMREVCPQTGKYLAPVRIKKQDIGWGEYDTKPCRYRHSMDTGHYISAYYKNYKYPVHLLTKFESHAQAVAAVKALFTQSVEQAFKVNVTFAPAAAQEIEVAVGFNSIAVDFTELYDFNIYDTNYKSYTSVML